MALVSSLRPIVAATLSFGTWYLCAGTPARATEPVECLADRSAAIAQARKQGKLLFVVHLSGDFAANSSQAREAIVYRRLALSDPRVVRHLAHRFVVALEHVGEASTLKRLTPSRKPAPAEPAEYAITYFCLPDERVIHFVPGYVSADELLAALEFAERCYAHMLTVQSAEQPLVVRRSHVAAVTKDDLAVFERLFATRWREGSSPSGESTVDIPPAFRAAKDTFERSLATRAGAGWSRKDAPELLSALGAHGGLAGEMAHLVLAEFPLAAFSDLARPTFEQCTGRRFWQASRRRAALAEWRSRAVADGRPVLLVVANDAFGTDDNGQAPLAWPPERAAAVPQLAQFTSDVVTIDELALLLADAELDPITFTEFPPRYVLFDESGKLVAELPRSANYSRLAQAMQAIVTPGGLAKAAGATKGNDR